MIHLGLSREENWSNLWQLENGQDDDQPWDSEHQFYQAHIWLRLYEVVRSRLFS